MREVQAMMIAYQCSRCVQLVDCDEHCQCMTGIDPRTNHRQKGDAAKCRSNFEALEKDRQWHEPFAWEY